MNNKAIGYTRVSTREQARSGLSMESQERSIREYCQYKRLEMIRLISDPGSSGKDLNRSGIRNIQEHCRRGDIGHVVVYSMDRLSRNTLDLLTVIRDDFQANKVELHSITESLDTGTAVGKLYITVRAAFNQYQRDDTSERTKAALRQKAVRGEPVGSPPLGWECGDGGKFLRNDQELKVIERIKRLRREKQSLKQIAERLNQGGVPTKRGVKWTTSTVYRAVNSSKHKRLYS